MTIQIEMYIKSLAREYLILIDLMQSGDYDSDELRELSSQRSGVHNELIRVLGDEYARPFDIQKYCKEIVR